MTLFCIIFAVFMVTVVFGMVEMEAGMEQARFVEKHDGFSISVLFNSTIGQTLLLGTGIILLLALFADILMIFNSLNSGVAQKTEFFEMMRYIGMSRK